MGYHLKEMRPYQLHEAVARGVPLLVPAGCIECHGPHMALGHDTIIVEEVCKRIGERVPCVIAPSFDYGPTGYAVSGPPRPRRTTASGRHSALVLPDRRREERRDR